MIVWQVRRALYDANFELDGRTDFQSVAPIDGLELRPTESPGGPLNRCHDLAEQLAQVGGNHHAIGFRLAGTFAGDVNQSDPT